MLLLVILGFEIKSFDIVNLISRKILARILRDFVV